MRHNTLKVEPSVHDMTQRGLTHIMEELNLIDVSDELRPETAPQQMIVQGASWVRAGSGGFLRFHVAPGDTVEKEQPLATNTGLLGEDYESIVRRHGFLPVLMRNPRLH